MIPLRNLIYDPVLVTLLGASLVSLAIIIDRGLALWSARRADTAFQHGRAVSASPLARLFAEFKRHAPARREHLATLLDTAIVAERHRLEGALPVLGVIGSTAPYIGLFGTVIGVIRAFQAIQAQNNMSPSVVAGGIATALVATAMGLAVAIPAVAAHHLLSAAIARMTSGWEAVAARWLPEGEEKEAADESAQLAQT